MINSNTSYYQ